MRKYLLPENGQFYKANLHCHTTVSDGGYTPQQMKEAYLERGYSIIAYTDHNVLVPHPELTDENFLALYGTEYDITEEKPGVTEFHRLKTCHICLIATDPDYVVQPYFRRTWVYDKQEDKSLIKYDESLPLCTYEYTPEYINGMIKEARDKGYFVTYNHPAWSQEGYEIYSKYEGMHAMEICNYGCITEGYHDYNAKVYQELLHQGKKIYCVAADDNHNGFPKESPYYDSFGGFTMIKADKLEYRAVTDALLKGHFYASQGPEIYSLFIEGNKLHIETSDAASITFTSGIRHCYTEFPTEGDHLNGTIFDVWPQDKFVRITVTDKEGRKANTNAYFVEDLLK